MHKPTFSHSTGGLLLWLSALAACGPTGEPPPAAAGGGFDVVEAQVAGIHRAMEDGRLTARRLVELYLARIEALVRRQRPAEAQTRLRVGDLEMDLLARRVVRGGTRIELQPREFRLLEYLMKHAGQVVTRTMLLENVWEYHFDPQTNVIDVHISRLRAKIDKGFARPLLNTVRGAGYCIRETE